MMSSITLFRIIKNGLLSYKRNFWLAVAATVVMTITIFIISTLLIIRAFTAAAVDNIQDKVDVSVFFTLETTEQTITQIKNQVELLPEVKSVVYIPPTEARDRFLELHQNEPLLLESVNQFDDEENPFPASLAIRVNKLDDYSKIINLFQEEKFEPFVSRITDKRDVVDQLNQISKSIINAGLILTIVFSIVTVVVMFNTIRLTIYNRRKEIEIMRLVGGTNHYIRGPFLVEGLLYGFVGTIISALLIYPMLYLLQPKINSFFEIAYSQVSIFDFNIWYIGIFQFAFAILLGIISSLIAIRRYLNI